MNKRSGIGSRSDAAEKKSMGRRQLSKPAVPRLGAKGSKKGKGSKYANDDSKVNGKERFVDPQFKQLVELLEVTFFFNFKFEFSLLGENSQAYVRSATLWT